ncbi:MAG: FTR1 family iron permease [Peptoniphilaceae bacterium]|uniref:FTR1 family iron permease n=1 Tax=Parvimonas sp. TaxID=1944660 RepID=UPI0025F4FCCE|nr:FTR1 family protein [Parvimonas sp.]MCI5998030.1 FTR1 family iron permease [Parvimonas sp.]MDD7764964.1 FTR1 family iron permease [Peptoniphilaceae bacterium]MDY3050352.1 FTR1 family protein [Parvimonas sp.]
MLDIKKLISFFAIFFAILFSFNFTSSYTNAEKKKYENWQGVAKDMHLKFTEAKEYIDKNEYQKGYDAVNSAYFDYYEIQGFEKNVMVAISNDRVMEIESLFREIKHVLLGNTSKSSEEVKKIIDDLDMKVYKDALVLDKVISKSAPDSEGKVVFENAQIQKGNEKEKNIQDFFTSFSLMLREGMEAILVCVAIIAYLVKTGNKNLCKSVYLGMGAAIVCSFGLALLINMLLGGVGQELLEGWTMFLAVIVLFYVSNWILSKSEEEAWENYIQSKVQKSIDNRSKWALVFAAFLAVLREGAELILFYKAAFSGSSKLFYPIAGFFAATAVLIVVFLIFRFTSVKIPLKPFFLFTSILLYLMCISFMGKGVIELTEAGVISGSTVIPAMKGWSIPILNIYDRAETLIPQIMLVIITVWILVGHYFKLNKIKKEKLDTNHIVNN